MATNPINIQRVTASWWIESLCWLIYNYQWRQMQTNVNCHFVRVVFLKGSHATDYEPPHPKHLPELCSLFLWRVCVCISYSWLAADKDSLQPQITKRQKLQSELCVEEVKITAFCQTVFFLQISVYSSAEQQFILVTFCLSYYRNQESLRPQLQVHNTAVGNTGILGAGKTSEFFLSPVESDRKKEVTVCGDGWSSDLQVIG